MMTDATFAWGLVRVATEIAHIYHALKGKQVWLKLWRKVPKIRKFTKPNRWRRTFLRIQTGRAAVRWHRVSQKGD